MRFLLIFTITISLIACEQEEVPPRLAFSTEEWKWFVYKQGDTITFKNNAGDSLLYTIKQVSKYRAPEYTDSTFSTIAAYTEAYLVKIRSLYDSVLRDSIVLYFYKELQHNSDPNKLKMTAQWVSMKGQFFRFPAIDNAAPFTSQTINGTTYTKVTPAAPLSQTIYPFTRFDSAVYDQQAGFIEIIDRNGVSWKRD